MDNWDELLTAAEFAINNATQTSTGFSPFELDTGQQPRLPLDLLAPTNVPAVEDFVKVLEIELQRARDNFRRARQAQALQANKHRKDVSFKVGDMVLVKPLL